MSTIQETPPEYVETLQKRGFTLGSAIGRGAFGRVYKAEQVSLRRAVAVKFYDNEYTKGEANRKRVEREALLLARVQHPAIPYVLTTGVVARKGHGQVPYCVMQYIEGTSLDVLLAKGKPAIDVVRRVMHAVLSALENAHLANVLHRDVKPDNVIVAPTGVYLIDFSIGVMLAGEKGLTRATRIGERVGTADYAAPEQIRDSSDVDHRCDIYSAGVLLAEMLGAKPRLNLMTLDVELHGVSHELRDIIRLASADERQQRFVAARDFRERLDDVLDPGTVSIYDEKLSLCPNTKCPGAQWSSGSGHYLWGPKIVGPTSERFCDACGHEYVRGCVRCRRELPQNLSDLVVKRSKMGDDKLAAHCSACGTLLFRVPTCKSCGSYLTAMDLDKDTMAGCRKCLRAKPTGFGDRGRAATAVATPVVAAAEEPPLGDDDIPF